MLRVPGHLAAIRDRPPTDPLQQDLLQYRPVDHDGRVLPAPAGGREEVEGGEPLVGQAVLEPVLPSADARRLLQDRVVHILVDALERLERVARNLDRPTKGPVASGLLVDVHVVPLILQHQRSTQAADPAAGYHHLEPTLNMRPPRANHR